MQFLWTTIHVEDMDTSIEFYQDMVGLKVLRRLEPGPGVEIAFLGNGLENETLIELLADSGDGTVSFSHFISIGFAVDSLDEMLRKVRNRSIPIVSDPVETPGFRFFCIQDPDGLQVQFFQSKQP